MLKKKMSKAVKGLAAMILAAACIANTGVTVYAANGYRGDSTARAVPADRRPS